MKKFCEKCGAKLDPITKLCPNCDNVSEKREKIFKKAVIICIISFVIAVVSLSIAAYYLLSSDNDNSSSARFSDFFVKPTVLEDATEKVKETEKEAEKETQKETQKEKTKEKEETKKKKTSSTGSTKNKYEGYRDLLQAYVNSYPWDSYPQIGEFEGLSSSYYKRTLDDMGFAFVDVDDNGQKELFIGTTDSEAIGFSDMFTIINGKIEHVCASQITAYYVLCNDDTICYKGFGNGTSSIVDKRVLSGDGKTLKTVERVATDGAYAMEIGIISDPNEAGPETIYFYSTSDDYEDYEHISSSKANAKLDSFTDSYVKIDFTPFSEFK